MRKKKTYTIVIETIATYMYINFFAVSYGTELQELCMKYLKSICDEEVIGIGGKENTIGSALSVINILLASWEDRTKFLQEGMLSFVFM